MNFSIFDKNDTEDFEYLLDSIGQDVLLNGQPIRAVITNTILEQNYGDYRISSLSPLPRGGIVDYNDQKYMLISEQPDKRYNKWKSILRHLPYTLTFNASCSFFHVPAFIETQSFGVNDGNIISVADGQIYVYVPDNEHTRQIKITDRFLKFGQAFKVVGIDRFSKAGMNILTCEKDSISPALDDVINDIAGGKGCIINITNSKPVNITVGNTVQLTWTATSNFPVVFSSSDEIIATIDGNGLFTSHSSGVVTVTVSNATSPSIKDTIIITVEDLPVTKTIQISGENEVYAGFEETYTAKVYQGTNQVSEPVSWSLWNDAKTGTTSYATIKSQNGTSCVVLGNTAFQYVQLKATLVSDSSVVEWRRLQIKSVI